MVASEASSPPPSSQREGEPGAISPWSYRALGGGDHRVALIACAILVIGIALRVWSFAAGRSLWLDEAMVSTAIINRDFAGLLQPLDFSQVAPIGWIFLEKAMLQLSSAFDYSLRVPQLAAGLGALVLMASVSRRTFAHAGFLTAITLFALGSRLILHSSEAKPYEVDVFFSLAFVAFSVRYFFLKAPVSWVGLVGLAATGVVAIVLSLPVVIVMACFGLLLFLRESTQRRIPTAIGVGIVGIVWLAVFAYLYLAFYKTGTTSLDSMASDWRANFAPFPPESLADLKWYWKSTFGLFAFFFGDISVLPVVVAFCIGTFVLIRRNWMFGVFLIAPFLISFIVSGLRLYPMGIRLSLFLAPQFIMLTAAGVDYLVSAIRTQSINPSRSAWAASFISIFLVATGSLDEVWQNFSYYSKPYATQDIRPILETVAATKAPDEPVYVARWTLAAFRIYQKEVGLGDAEIIEGKPTFDDFRCMLKEIERLQHRGRVWVIYSHPSLIFNQSEDAAFSYFLNVVGEEVSAVHAVSVHAFLFDFNALRDDAFTLLLDKLPVKGACE